MPLKPEEIQQAALELARIKRQEWREFWERLGVRTAYALGGAVCGAFLAFIFGFLRLSC